MGTVLREQLMNAKFKGMKISDKHIAAISIKAWNKMIVGESIKILRWTDNESFPEIVG